MKRLLLALLLLTGCADARPDLVLVLIDSFPAGDHEPAAGLATLSAATARAPATSALPSAASILSGQQPTEHGALTRYDRVGGAVPWLPAALQASGYRTVGLLANPQAGPRQGIDRGFDEVRTAPRGDGRDVWRATWAMEDARDLLAAEEPTFLLVELVEASAPWLGSEAPAEPYDGLLPSTRAEAADRATDPRRYPELMAGRYAGDDADRKRLRQLHGARLAAIDQALTTLLDAVDDDAVVVVVGTHGEGLDRHGVFTHGGAPFEHQVRVPVFANRPLADDDAFELVDLGPWLATQGKVELASSGNGALAAALDGQTPAPGSTLSHARLPDGRESWAVVQGGHKLMVTGERARLYDLAADPDELRDLAGTKPELEKALGAELNRRVQALASAEAGAEADEALLEQLRVLGYVE